MNKITKSAKYQCNACGYIWETKLKSGQPKSCTKCKQYGKVQPYLIKM